MYSQHHRHLIWNLNQHPYRHSLNEFSYSNPALPGVTQVEAALNYIVAVLYPQTQPSVANVAALPASGNTLNDFRVVNDNGVDGKAAGYRWEQREGEASPSWHKIYDMDWGVDSILTQFHNQAQALYAFKGGNDDLDASGNTITGTFAGQRIYGGYTAGNNLTLSPNSGDGAGAVTGFVQVTNHFRPTTANAFDLGTTALKFRTAYLGTSAVINTMTLSTGSITDSSGTINFGSTALTTTGTVTASHLVANDGVHTVTIVPGSITDNSGAISFGTANLSTTGSLASGTHTVSSDLTLATGSITSASGTVSFGSNTISTTGAVTAGSASVTTLNAGNLRISGNTLSATNTNGGITLTPNGAGTITLSAGAFTQSITATGSVTASVAASGGNLQLSGNVLSSTNTNGDITITPNGTGTIIKSALHRPSADNTLSSGTASYRWSTVYVGTGIGDGTNSILVSTLLSLRSVAWRDAAHTQPAQTGDALFYDATSGTWLASVPDTEINHTTLSGLLTGDAGHTQFAMLAGRSGGQTIQGGTAGGENLLLESTANATKGLIKAKDTLVPNTTASYSSGWSGTDLGGTSNYWNNIFMKGEAKGLRFENLATGSISFSAQTPGRMYFDTTLSQLKFDTGAAINTLIDNSSTQTMSNKTHGTALTFAQVSTPSSPASGYDKIYFKSDDQPYFLNSAGVETAFATGTTFTTGDIKATIKTTADSGWVMLNDGTIGSASSGATTRANADTQNLYTLIWNNIAQAYATVTGGRGASAAADFAAGKPIALPKALGRVLGASGTGSGLTARSLGQTVGEESHTLTSTEIPGHTHSGTTYTESVTHQHVETGASAGAVGGPHETVFAPNGYSEVDGSDYTESENQYHTHGFTTDTGAVGGGGHNTMQPTLFVNYMIKL